MALDLLKVICDIGAVSYDIFYTLGVIASTPINILSDTVINYTNPISYSLVSVNLTNNFIIDLIEKLAEFFDKNFIFTYDSWFSENLTILGIIVGLIISIAIIRFVAGLIGAFIPD